MSTSHIREFYEGQHIFITGGNGFIGKILVEKLLRSTNISTVYLLMRRKRGKDVSVRLEEMLENEPFRKLKEQQPDFKTRIKAIVGDNTFPDLGLSSAQLQELFSNVNVVFHVAATIRFHEDIKVAYDTNVGMTAKIIALCKQMRNLKSFIYVSTAYSNCYLNYIEEEFYDDLDIDYNQVETLLHKSNGPEKLTEKILQTWPNTYSCTKALAELLVKDKAKELPVGIFRPSIVISTYKEPLEGWTDTLGGPNILVGTVASGFTRFFCCNIKYVVDLVPVDMTVAALIASAWDVHEQRKNRMNKIPIYNYVSSVDNPVTYDEFIKLNILVNTERYPFYNCLWIPKMTITKKSPILNFFLDATYHYIPAALIDIASILCLKKPTMLAKYRKFNVSRYHMEYFMSHEWTFKNGNVKKMWNKMDETDKETFHFDVKSLNWVSYFRSYYQGIRFYLFKEPWNNLSQARIRANRLKTTHGILKFVFYFLGITSLWIMLLRIIPNRLINLALVKLRKQNIKN